MKLVQPAPLLKTALRADALVSAAFGLLQLAAAEPLAALLSLPAGLLTGSGDVMLVYTLLLLVMASRSRLPRVLVMCIVLGNVAWGLACMALPLEGVMVPSALGLGFLTVHVAGVWALGAFEWLGLRRSAAEPAAYAAHGGTAHGGSR